MTPCHRRAPGGAGGASARSWRWYSPAGVIAMRIAGRSPSTSIRWNVLAGATIHSPAVTRTGSDLALQRPGQLALIDRPALVDQVVVPVVAVARRLADDHDHKAVVDHQRRGPRRRAVAGLQLLDPHRDALGAEGGRSFFSHALLLLSGALAGHHRPRRAAWQPRPAVSRGETLSAFRVEWRPDPGVRRQEREGILE